MRIDVGSCGGEWNIDTGLLTVKLQLAEQADRLILPAVAEDIIHRVQPLAAFYDLKSVVFNLYCHVRLSPLVHNSGDTRMLTDEAVRNLTGGALLLTS